MNPRLYEIPVLDEPWSLNNTEYIMTCVMTSQAKPILLSYNKNKIDVYISYIYLHFVHAVCNVHIMYQNKVSPYEYLILYIQSPMVHIYSQALCNDSLKWAELRIGASKIKWLLTALAFTIIIAKLSCIHLICLFYVKLQLHIHWTIAL